MVKWCGVLTCCRFATTATTTAARFHFPCRYNLPTWGDYKWASVQVGADVVYIPHTDNNYCTRCTYVVGVYGFTNST